jgi:hypothetical protein
MISAHYKGHEGRITSAICSADIHAKLDQKPFQPQGRQRLLPSIG